MDSAEKQLQKQLDQKLSQKEIRHLKGQMGRIVSGRRSRYVRTMSPEKRDVLVYEIYRRLDLDRNREIENPIFVPGLSPIVFPKKVISVRDLASGGGFDCRIYDVILRIIASYERVLGDIIVDDWELEDEQKIKA